MRSLGSREARRILQKMKMKVEELSDVQQVLIKTTSKEIIINKPSVSIFSLKGEKIFQILGEAIEKTSEVPVISEEDVQLVAQQTGASLEEAKKALEQAKGNLAEAILSLKGR